MNPIIDYIWNVKGNLIDALDKMKKNVTEVTGELEKTEAQAKKTKSAFAQLADKGFQLDNLVKGAQQLTDGIQGLIAPGVALNTSLVDLQAITGVTGDKLQQIEGYARATAKAFGIDAAGAVESYKLILGQLAPELAQSPVALKAMGEHVATLSKLMGGDATAAAEVLNTAMNQYGVDLSDPTAAAEEMARMMNVMAAAGQEGSAELPQIKEALEQAGMAAKGAGVSFEETNAAIQVLDKAGKKGSEGGIALRNVLATLAQGRFLPKDARKELARAGISVTALGDKSKSLKERLDMLRPVMEDSALLAKLFGKENTNAAMALIGGADEVADYTDKIRGTQSAHEQAEVVMTSFVERQARIRQQFDDLKISLLNATGDLGMWSSVVGEALVPIAQILPLLGFMGTLGKYAWQYLSLLAGVIAKSTVWQGFLNFLAIARTRMIAFAVSSWIGTKSVVLFALRGIWAGISALGYYLISLVTGGAAQIGFALNAQIAFASFSVAAQTACRAVSAAIMSIPIIGWIAAAIAALVALGVYFWNTSAKFRAVLKGLWAACKAIFGGIWDMAKDVFTGIGELILAAFSFDGDGINKALDKMTGAMSKFGAETANAFKSAYDEEMARSEAEAKAEEERKKHEQQGDTPIDLTLPDLTELLNGGGGGGTTPPKPPKPGTLGGDTSLDTGGKGKGSGNGIRNVTIHIGKLVESLHIHTSNLQGDNSEVKAAVTEVLLSAVNDTNLAIQ